MAPSCVTRVHKQSFWSRLAVATLSVAIALSGIFMVVAQKTRPSQKQTRNEPVRFDFSVREDFFAGLAGDEKALERAMKLCEQMLAKDPRNADALVWHGAGTYFRGGRMISSGDWQRGKELVVLGGREMDEAVALKPGLETLIPRASVLMEAASHMQSKEYRDAALKKSVNDFEQVLKLDSANFAQHCEHDRGELLGNLAQGWYLLGDQDKARQYLTRMTTELKGSVYAVASAKVLETSPAPENVHLTCMGCHTTK